MPLLRADALRRGFTAKSAKLRPVHRHVTSAIISASVPKIAIFTKNTPQPHSFAVEGHIFILFLLYIRLGNFNHKIRNREGRTGVYAVIRLVIIASVFVVLCGNINFTREEL